MWIISQKKKIQDGYITINEDGGDVDRYTL